MIEKGDWQLAFEIIAVNGQFDSTEPGPVLVMGSRFSIGYPGEITVITDTDIYEHIEQVKNELESKLHISIRLTSTNSSREDPMLIMIGPQPEFVGQAVANYLSSRAFRILTKWSDEVSYHGELIPLMPFVYEGIRKMQATT